MRLQSSLIAVSIAGVCAAPVSQAQECRWSSVGPPLSPLRVDRSVFSLGVFDDGGGPSLYAGGEFVNASGRVVNRIARWDGLFWSPLVGPSGTGVNHHVRAMTVFDDGEGEALYVAGDFNRAGGLTVKNIARWDGTAWSALTVQPPLDSGTIHALAVFDDGNGEALYAGGRFSIGARPASIVKWDGTTWTADFGSFGGAYHDISDMVVFDDGSGPALYVGGFFTQVGSQPMNRIAKWDGTAWSPLPSEVDGGNVFSLRVLDDGTGPALYAGGNFTHAGGQLVNGIAKWDGTTWSPLEGPAGVGVTGEPVAVVHDMAVFDSGTGPALFVVGLFTGAGGQTVSNIAKWNGEAWSPLPGQGFPGLSSDGYVLHAFNDGTGSALYAGGRFTIAGGQPADHIAKWRCLTCFNRADLNGDGVLDAEDFFLFLQWFANSDLRADINFDNNIDADDFLEFLDLFAQGC